MLGPCPLRRRAVRTARYASLLTSANVAQSNNGNKVATSSRDNDLRTLEDDIGELRWDEDSFTDSAATAGLDLQRSSVDIQPLQLVSKPQPRARARPVSPSLSQQAASLAGDASAAGRRAAEDTSAPSSDDVLEVHPTAEGSDPDAPLRGMHVEEAPMGLKAKTLAVRRRIEEQRVGVTLHPPAGALSPRVGNFMPSAGERMSQRQIAHLNKAAKRALRASRSKAGASDDGFDSDPDAAAASTSTSRLAAAGRPSYGRPPLRSVHSLPADPSPGAVGSRGASASAVNSPAAPQYAELPTAGSLPRPTRAEVERLVRECGDLGALRMLYGMYGARLSVEELVLMVAQLAEVHDPTYMTVNLWTATQAMLVELLQRITPQLDDLTMQEYVLMLSAVAKLRYVPPGDWIAAVLTQSKPRLYNASPSHLAHVLKAVARITVDPYDVKSAATWEGWMRRFLTAVQRQLPAFRADELVKTLVALSELRFRPPPEWMHKFSAALHSRLEVLEAHSLSEAMLAFAALRYQPEGPFLRAYYSQLYARLPLADDQDLATYAQAAALLDRLCRQDFMQEFLAEVVEKLPTFKPQHLANLLNAMGRLASPSSPSPSADPRVRIPPGWTEAVAAHVGGHLKSFSGSALASAAWGLSALGHKAKPKFLDDLLSASYGKLHSCGPTDLILLLTALGNYGFAPMPGREELWDTWMTEFERFAARKSYDTRGVCDLMDAMARLPRPTVPLPLRVGVDGGSGGVGPAATGSGGGGSSGGQQQQQPPRCPRPLHPDFVAGVLRSTRIYQLRNTSPGRLAALAGALAALGVRPDFGFLYNYAQAARVMWTGFSARDYATLLGAMVHIGTPGLADSRWAADFLAITLCRMADFDGPSLAASLDALRRLPKPEFTPSSQWLAAAAQRAVDLIRSPPPPVPAAAAAGTVAPPPAAAMANVGSTVTPLHVLAPPGSGGAAAGPAAATASGGGGGGKAASPAGDWWAPPMRPLTPELLVVLVEALAALGYRTESNAPLVQIVRSLLSTTATRRRLQERLGGSAAAGPQAVTPLMANAVPPPQPASGEVAEAHHPQHQRPHDVQKAEGPASGGPAGAGAAAAAAGAFDRAKVAAAAAAAAMSGEAPRPPLDRMQAAALEAALGALLGSALPEAAAAAAAKGPTLAELPRTAMRSPEDIAAAESRFAAKLAAREERRKQRLAAEASDLVEAGPAGSSSGGEGDGSDGGEESGCSQAGASTRRPGVRLPAYSPGPAASPRPHSAPVTVTRRRGKRVGSGGGGGSLQGSADSAGADTVDTRPGSGNRASTRRRVKAETGTSATVAA